MVVKSEKIVGHMQSMEGPPGSSTMVDLDLKLPPPSPCGVKYPHKLWQLFIYYISKMLTMEQLHWMKFPVASI